jgi:hypothetical protein
MGESEDALDVGFEDLKGYFGEAWDVDGFAKCVLGLSEGLVGSEIDLDKL